MANYKMVTVTGITLANAAFGCLSVMASFAGEFMLAAQMIVIAVIFDQMDGRVARAIGSASDIGRELDSLSDAVSFGVAPMMILYMKYLSGAGLTGQAAAIVFALAAIYRLAKFNVTDVNTHFLGVATPVAAGFVVGLVVADVALLPEYIIAACLVFAYLMVSNVKYFNFKNSHKLTKGEKMMIGTVGVIALAVIALDYRFAILGIVLSYVLLGPFFFSAFKAKK